MLDPLVDIITKSEVIFPVEREKLYGFLAAIGFISYYNIYY